MGALKWLDENIEEFLLMIFLILMVSIMGFQVVMRYAFNASLVWSEELTRYLFIWSTFLSISYCVKKQISIKIDQLFNVLPKSVQKVTMIITKTVMFLFFCYILKFSIDVVRDTYLSGQKSPALGLPMYLVQISTVVGFSLSGVRIIQSLFRVIKRV